MPKASRIHSNIGDIMLHMMNPQISCKMSKLISSFLKSYVIMVSLRQGIVFHNFHFNFSIQETYKYFFSSVLLLLLVHIYQ